MPQRVALLRGINLGKINRVPMPELREIAQCLGFREPSTHQQSGNLVYRSEESAAHDRVALTRALHERYGHKIDLVIVECSRLERLLAQHPFADGDPKSVHIGFAPGPLPAEVTGRIAKLAREWERFEVDHDILFADYGGRFHDSRVATSLARLTRPGFITMRNMATIVALAEKTRGI